MVLHTQSPAGGHPLILGRPWLATANAYIGCRSRNMVISNGEVKKNIILYPPIEPSSSDKPGFTLTQKPLPTKGLKLENEEIRPILTIGEALCFKDETNDDAISTFISSPNSIFYSTHHILESVMHCNVQEAIKSDIGVENILVLVSHNSIPIEIELGNMLTINLGLSPYQSE